MKFGLYIITHKKMKETYPNDRKIMMVGAKNKDLPAGYYSDFNDNKENISIKNRSFCELTGMYYFVKNDDSDILSLEHYRRRFVKTRFYLFHYPFFKQKDVEKLLEKADIILPKKSVFKEGIYNQYINSHEKGDLDKLEKIILNKYPDYLDSYKKVMNGKETYLCNMFIGKKEVVEKYSNWLFNILFELEKQIDILQRDDYQKRVFGFLSERLMTIYFENHPEIIVCQKQVQMIQGNAFICKVKRLWNKLFKLNK